MKFIKLTKIGRISVPAGWEASEAEYYQEFILNPESIESISHQGDVRIKTFSGDSFEVRESIDEIFSMIEGDESGRAIETWGKLGDAL